MLENINQEKAFSDFSLVIYSSIVLGRVSQLWEIMDGEFGQVGFESSVSMSFMKMEVLVHFYVKCPASGAVTLLPR